MIKWTAPFPGACKETRVYGVRYVIINERLDEYYLARYQDENIEIHKFKTWVAMYKWITGRYPVTKDGKRTIDEGEAYNLVRLVTYETTALNYRELFKDGTEWVLYEPDKRIYKLILPERLSRTFYRERDAIEWATNYLESLTSQISITDLLD